MTNWQEVLTRKDPNDPPAHPHESDSVVLTVMYCDDQSVGTIKQLHWTGKMEDKDESGRCYVVKKAQFDVWANRLSSPLWNV